MSLRDILKTRYINAPLVLAKRDLLSDQEYSVVSSIRMRDLQQLGFNPRVLNAICISEQSQLAAHCDYLETCYESKVRKIRRRLRSVKPRLPRPTTAVRDLADVPRSVAPAIIEELPSMANVQVAQVTGVPDVPPLVPEIPALSDIPLPRELTLEERPVMVPYHITHEEIGDFGQLEDAREFLGADVASAAPMPPSDEAIQELILNEFPSLNVRTKQTDRFMDYVESTGSPSLARPGPSSSQLIRTLPEIDSIAMGMQSLLLPQALPKTSTPLQQPTVPLASGPTMTHMIEASLAHLEPPASQITPPSPPPRPIIRQPRSFARMLPVFQKLPTLPPLRTTYPSFPTMIESYETTNNIIGNLFPLPARTSIAPARITRRRSSLYMRAIENSQVQLANEDSGMRQAATESSGQASLFPTDPTPIIVAELPVSRDPQDSQCSSVGVQQQIPELSLPSDPQPVLRRRPQIRPLNRENQIARELFGDTQPEMSLAVGPGRPGDVAMDGDNDAATAADVDFTPYERIYCTLLCIQAVAASNYAEQIEDPDEMTIEQIGTFMNIETRLQHATLFGNLLQLQCCGFISITQHPVTFAMKIKLQC